MKREEKREHHGYRELGNRHPPPSPDLVTKRTPDIRRSIRFFFSVQNVLSTYVSHNFRSSHRLLLPLLPNKRKYDTINKKKT